MPKEHLDALHGLFVSLCVHSHSVITLVEETPVCSSCGVINWYRRAWKKHFVVGRGAQNLPSPQRERPGPASPFTASQFDSEL